MGSTLQEILFNGVASYLVFLGEKSESTAYTVMIAVETGRVEGVDDHVNEFGMENAVEINQEFRNENLQWIVVPME